MKHRIVKVGDRFYPERKGWLGWSRYTETEVCMDGLVCSSWVSFSNLDSAKKFFEPIKIETAWESET